MILGAVLTQRLQEGAPGSGVLDVSLGAAPTAEKPSPATAHLQNCKGNKFVLL